MANKLKVLIPVQAFETSAGEVKLTPFKVKQFPAALDLIQKYTAIVLEEKVETILDEEVRVSKPALEIVQEILAKDGEGYQVLDDLAGLMALVSNLKSLDDLQYDEAIALFVEVIDMNKDFFTQLGNRLKKEEPEGATAKATIGT